MSKNNKDNKKEVSRLYRLYQEKRDNIPSTVLWGLLNTAKAKNHVELIEEQNQQEAKIQAILQAAKITPSENHAITAQKRSLKDRLNRIWQGLFTPSFGGGGKQWVAISAVLVLMLAINWVPSPQKFDPYLDVAYLEDCSVCGQLAMSSTIKVRNIDLNASNTEPMNHAAKFGRLALDLELVNRISASNIDITNSALMNTVRSLAEEKENEPVIEYLNQFDTKHTFSVTEINQTIQFLNQTFEKPTDNDLYHAGQWFERLRITNDSAIQTQHFSPIKSALEGIETLQSKLRNNETIAPDVLSAMEQLSQLQQSNRYDVEQAQQISAIIKKVLPLLNM